MPALRRRHNHFEAKVRVPASQMERVGKPYLYRTFPTADIRVARAEAAAWEAGLKLEWLEPDRKGDPSEARRHVYSETRLRAEEGAYIARGVDPELSEEQQGISIEIDKLAEAYGPNELLPVDEARLHALQDASKSLQGLPVAPRAAYEATFLSLSGDYLKVWRAQHGLKPGNTETQKQATFGLFAGFFGSRPIRQVRKADAATFVDALRTMDPAWARTPAGRAMSWKELQKAYGGRPKGMADATVNRHINALQAFWQWAHERGHCDGANPFKGLRRNLRPGINKQGYVAWTDEELKKLFNPAPRRADLAELMIVALHSGMRLNEIAALTAADIHSDGSIPFMRVGDAKTEAGKRDVPIHPKLAWLVRRADGLKPEDRLWPTFREEGAGKKPGADAGKIFTAHKQAAGFRDRRKAFHSFRKNFVGLLEALRVPEQEVAQLVGHAKPGFTFGTYGGAMTLARKAEVVALVGYGGLPIQVED